MTTLEYIWIDGYNTLRSKTKFFNNKLDNIKLDSLPVWNYDGSSTNQATTESSEIMIHPVYSCKDPFRRNLNSYLILCEARFSNGESAKYNYRSKANLIFEKYLEQEPMFGIEQEFFISKNNTPIGFLERGYPNQQKMYYCGVGGDNVIGRKLAEESFENCIYAGLSVTGLNAEVAPSQWEIQICDYGIEAADQLIMMRYIINRTLEIYNLNLDINPKPINGEWNGSGCHVNFSTKKIREEKDYNYIVQCIENLGKKHKESIKIYGENNDKRLVGKFETSSIDSFSYGVGNRESSIRIPNETKQNQCGYFEDRRPASNMDPYLVTSSILKFIQ